MPTHRISGRKWDIVTPSFHTEGRMKFYHEANEAIPRQFNRGNADTQPEAVTSKRDNTMNNSSQLHTGKRIGASRTKEFKFPELAMLSITPIVRSIHHWWLQRAERHYLICADVEQQRAREAQMNVAYYQKRAALARSARM
jgi:heme exporter protein D